MNEIEKVDPPPEIDDVLGTLGHRHRREIIRYFESNTSTREASVSELADQLGQSEEQPGDQPIRLQLHHIHLPKLEHEGWVEFDADDGHVRYTGRTSGS